LPYLSISLERESNNKEERELEGEEDEEEDEDDDDEGYLSPITLIDSRARSSCSLVWPAETQKRAREPRSEVAGKPTTTTASWMERAEKRVCGRDHVRVVARKGRAKRERERERGTYVLLERGARETGNLGGVEEHEGNDGRVLAADDTEAHLLQPLTEEVAVLTQRVDPLCSAHGMAC